ncbi:unnamed protein product, partial [Closterium sp. NIES-53]
APELLLGQKQYSTAIDVWSMGCIMAEIMTKKPLFKGESEIEQLQKIFSLLGTPTDDTWRGFSELPACKKGARFPSFTVNRLRELFPAISIGGKPTLSEAGFDLLSRMLMCDPSRRISAADAANHAWFREEPLPKAQQDMPEFPILNEKERRRRRSFRSPDPLKELQRQEKMREKTGHTGLFS